jgi:hypothetical protein
MPPISKWKIPHKIGSAEYQQCLRRCKRLGKPWTDLTEQEQKLNTPYPCTRTTAPQSVQKVREILKTTDAMDLSGIVQESGLGVRAVRYALKRLKDQDLIVERFNWKDARKTLYQKAKV